MRTPHRNTCLLLLCTLWATIGLAQHRPAQLPIGIEQQLVRQGFSKEDLADLVVKDHYATASAGMEHLFLRQRWQGIEVWNGDIAVHTGPGGVLLQLNNGAFDRLAERVSGTEPTITAETALQRVLARNLPGVRLPERTAVELDGRKLVFDGKDCGEMPITVQLVYRQQQEALRLAWDVSHYTPDGSHWWNVRIDALTGVEIDRNDWVISCAPAPLLSGSGASCAHGAHPEEEEAPALQVANSYRVFAPPVESPAHGSRSLRVAPWNAAQNASPSGWHSAGSFLSYTDTRGNNVFAQEDQDANNTGGYRPSGGNTMSFDFPLDLGQEPVEYLDAAITNLFYWNNIMHDVWYQYGFDEVAGNFQADNFGRGGSGGDRVYADAIDGSGMNNANFLTPTDGIPGRMQMFRFNHTTPRRTSDLDNVVIAHEYGHGISCRIVGGPSNGNCLYNQDQMGEGWSDWFGLMMTMRSGDQGGDPRGIATYLKGQPTDGVGLRPAPYSTDFGTNNHTYASTNSNTTSMPHGIGFVWCTMLWEMTWELIGAYGFDPDLYNGTGGNNIAMQLVIDGLKLTPCSPGFVDARDAIIQGDIARTGGQHVERIWAAFARRGLGRSADQGNTDDRTDQVEDFSLPVAHDLGVAKVISPTRTAWSCTAAAMPVTVELRNYGTQPRGNFMVCYHVGGTMVCEPFTGTIAPSGSALFTFAQPANLWPAFPMPLSFQASTFSPGDQVPGNDAAPAMQVWRTLVTDVVPTYSVDLESTTPTPDGWYISTPTEGPGWESFALGTQTACVGSRVWRMVKANGNDHAEARSTLTSPRVDLTTSAGSRLKFSHYHIGAETFRNSSLRIEVSADCGVSWDPLWSAVAPGPLVTVVSDQVWGAPTNCADWQQHDLDLGAYDGQQVMIRFVGIHYGSGVTFLDRVSVERHGIQVSAHALLEGPYDAATGLMRDDLRSQGLLPSLQPYTALGHMFPHPPHGRSIPAAVMNTSGATAIVDWVVLELRNYTSPATVVSAQPALLRRDGRIVAADGVSPVALRGLPGWYHVAVRHRNHLGIMTGNPLFSSLGLLSVNFTAPGTAVWGVQPTKSVGGVRLLWSGDVNSDGTIKYTGVGNDRDPILQGVGGVVPTQTATGYRTGDVNLDGHVRYTGAGNDRDPILQNVGGSVPTQTRSQQLP